MADIQITCTSCGTAITMSEFADIESFTCFNCGVRLSKPSGSGSARRPPTVRKLVTHVPAPATGQEKPEPSTPKKKGEAGPTTVQEEKSDAWRFQENVDRIRVSRKEKKFGHTMLSAGVFVLVGALFWALRYAIFPTQLLLNEYGHYLTLVVYILLIAMAFKDSVFQGTLALLVPIYPFYYIFVVSDEFYVRAVVAGMLVGLAQDSAAYYQQRLLELTNWVNAWIMSGGG